jgi:hypothetical protein
MLGAVVILVWGARSSVHKILKAVRHAAQLEAQMQQLRAAHSEQDERIESLSAAITNLSCSRDARFGKDEIDEFVAESFSGKKGSPPVEDQGSGDAAGKMGSLRRSHTILEEGAGARVPRALPAENGTPLHVEVVESLKAEREKWRGQQNQLTGDLREAQLHGESTEQLYRLLKALLGLQELRQAARSALANQWPEGANGVGPAVGRPAGLPEVTPPSDESKASTTDDAHRNAARIARVMVADLFLYNPHLLAPALTEEQIRSALERDYQGAHQTFRSRVSPRVWQATDYLQVEFEREIRKRLDSADRLPRAPSPVRTEQGEPIREASQDSPEPAAERTTAPVNAPPPVIEDEERVKARRVARVLVADLLLYHAKVLVPGATEQQVRTALAVELSAARETFESRVPERIRNDQDYFAIEFERRLRDRGVQPTPDPSSSSQPTPDASSSSQPTAETEAIADDQQHLRAASLARLLIAELLLDNWQQVETGVHDRNLLALLDEKCKAARQAFESRVPSRIWEETHYFEVQLEQLLWELQGGPLDVEAERQLNDFVSIAGVVPEEQPS